MSLYKLNKTEFYKKLKKRKLEDIEIIKWTERLLLKKRNFVFKMPRKKSPVILLLSGGMDSTTCWGILMEEYKLKVYPLTLNKGEKRRHKEEASLDFFCKFYSEKYPELFSPPFKLNVTIPEIRIPIEKATSILHPEIILKYLDTNGQMDFNLTLGSFSLSPLYAMLYSRHLLATQNLNIKTIFCAVMKGDDVPSQIFTALRMSTLALCTYTQEFDWQVSSVGVEKETGMFLSKADLVRWATQNNIPLEKTWSCYHNRKYHCGECAACYFRKKAFREARIVDKTPYESHVHRLVQIMKSRLSPYMKKLGIHPKQLKNLKVSTLFPRNGRIKLE